MSKRKSMIPTEFHTVNWLNLLRKPGSKPSGQVAQFAPDLRLRRTGISNEFWFGINAAVDCYRIIDILYFRSETKERVNSSSSNDVRCYSCWSKSNHFLVCC